MWVGHWATTNYNSFWWPSADKYGYKPHGIFLHYAGYSYGCHHSFWPSHWWRLCLSWWNTFIMEVIPHAPVQSMCSDFNSFNNIKGWALVKVVTPQPDLLSCELCHGSFLLCILKGLDLLQPVPSLLRRWTTLGLWTPDILCIRTVPDPLFHHSSNEWIVDTYEYMLLMKQHRTGDHSVEISTILWYVKCTT